jgi:VIT1/CCC1 family predicted Fe2+/Mn2+ transporter
VPNLLRARPAGALDPVDRASEVIFGLLMAMTFVGTLAVAEGGREELRTLLFAALGCNFAWGIADAVMYLVALATEQRRYRALLQRLHDVDAASGRDIVADVLMPGFAGALDEGDLDQLRLRLIAAPRPSGLPRLGSENYRAAIGVFLLVVLATFPVVLPYALADDVVTALRVSQAIAIAMLFAGSAIAAIGVLLLIVIVLLGG